MATDGTTTWFWALLPLNAAIGGLGTLVPLYVLSPAIRGTVVEVGTIVSAYNLALIPGSLVWGKVTDAYEKRRLLVVLPYLAMALLLPLFYFARDFIQLLILYSVFAFVAVAPVPAVNLLLMETTSKGAWPSMFARSSTISTVGLMLGVLPGAFWTIHFRLVEYFLLVFAFSVPAVLLAYVYVPEPAITLERRSIAHTSAGLGHRLFHIPMFFPKIPSLVDFRSFWRMIQVGLSEELPLLYITMFLFFTSASTFFTPYTPLLRSRQVSEAETFLANFFIFLVNAVAFPFAGRATQRYSAERVAGYALVLRTAGAMLAALFALRFSGFDLLLATLLVFAIMGVSFTFANTSSSTIIFRTLYVGRQGELLGVYSALTGVGLFIGAYASGFLSFHYGFSSTFAVSALMLLAALVIFGLFSKVTIKRFQRS